MLCMPTRMVAMETVHEERARHEDETMEREARAFDVYERDKALEEQQLSADELQRQQLQRMREQHHGYLSSHSPPGTGRNSQYVLLGNPQRQRKPSVGFCAFFPTVDREPLRTILLIFAPRVVLDLKSV